MKYQVSSLIWSCMVRLLLSFVFMVKEKFTGTTSLTSLQSVYSLMSSLQKFIVMCTYKWLSKVSLQALYSPHVQ